MHILNGRINLVICQKSKIDDWVQHFHDNYNSYLTLDLSNAAEFQMFCIEAARSINATVGVINYDLIIRRPELLKLSVDTLMLDESSMIKSDTAKRTKSILKIKTNNVILLSGTPTGGKYEELYSQLKLLGWHITKSQYYSEFIKTINIDVGGFKFPKVVGYKNVGRLKRKMREYGCNFLKTNEVFDLPQQTFTDIHVSAPKEYKTFIKNKIVEIDGAELVGDTTLTAMLYSRQLCGAYAADKLKAVADLIESTNDRLIIFYNFNIELFELKKICKSLKRPTSEVQEQKATYAKLMNSDRENTEALLASMPKKQVRIDDYINGGTVTNNMTNKTWDELDKAGKLAELKASDAALFAQKYEEKFGVPYKD